jgi:hypothetical protein
MVTVPTMAMLQDTAPSGPLHHRHGSARRPRATAGGEADPSAFDSPLFRHERPWRRIQGEALTRSECPLDVLHLDLGTQDQLVIFGLDQLAGKVLAERSSRESDGTKKPSGVLRYGGPMCSVGRADQAADGHLVRRDAMTVLSALSMCHVATRAEIDPSGPYLERASVSSNECH